MNIHRPRQFAGLLIRFSAEFIIIFLSITFTWWFEEWRQGNSDRHIEENLLKNLEANLRLDSMNLASELYYIQNSAQMFDDFLERIPTDDLRDSDSSGYLLRRLIITPEFHPNAATFEAIKATGELKLIRNDSLVQAVMNLYEVTYQELDFLIRIYNQTSSETIWDYVIEHHDLRKVLSDPSKRFYRLRFSSADDRQLLINKILFSLLAANFSAYRIENSLDQVQMTRKLIRVRLRELNV